MSKKIDSKKRVPRMIMETEGEFYSSVSEGNHQFVLFPPSGCIERGLFYPITKQGYTHCIRHENHRDIFGTTEHENIHQAIDLIHDWEIEDDQPETVTDDITEHRIIRNMLWIDEYLGITNEELGLDKFEFA